MSNFVGKSISSKDQGENLNLGDAIDVGSRESQQGQIGALSFVAVVMFS
jgi:hypothetical protein